VRLMRAHFGLEKEQNESMSKPEKRTKLEHIQRGKAKKKKKCVKEKEKTKTQ